jgi:hypothetical protein
MRTIVVIGAFALAISSVAAHAEVVTATGQGAPKTYACTEAKRDAERMARNKGKEVVQFSNCSCSYQTAYSSWYCEVEAQLEKKEK